MPARQRVHRQPLKLPIPTDPLKQLHSGTHPFCALRSMLRKARTLRSRSDGRWGQIKPSHWGQMSPSFPSREGLGGGSLGLMAYRDPKGERDKRMPEKRRSSPGVRGGASRDPRDMAKAGLPDIPIPRRRKGQSAGKTPETGAMLCGGIVEGSPQPPERGALPSEGNQGDEWDAYVVLGRMTGTNAGSTCGARAPW